MQPFRKLISARIYLLTLTETILAAACYTAAAFVYYPIEAHTYLMYDEGAQHIGLLTLVFLVISYLFDSSTQVQVTSRLVLVLQVAYLIGILLIAQAILAFLNPDLVAPQGIIVTGSALTLAVLTIWRLYLRPAAWNAIGAQRILFVGVGAAVDRLAEVFGARPALGMDVRGYIVESDIRPRVQPVLGGYRDLVRVVSEVNPDRVIVSADNLQDKRVLKTLFDMRAAGVTVESAADTYESIFGRIYSRAVEPYTVIFRNELSARPGSVALQSIYNNVLGIVSVIILLPIMAVVAMGLKLTRRGTVIVEHACIGLHGHRFNRYRFRCDGNDVLSRFLTKYKVEGLPQIMNIFRGEMALIGPRPDRAEFSYIIDDLVPLYRQRYSVKPGVMGWSQLHCDTIPVEDTLARIEYDLYYIKHISLVLDAYILLRALKWMLSDSETAAGLSGAASAP
jgi:lipopolysaccharide/colanic/teichoic acid biosynthesis glycosyltransferase